MTTRMAVTIERAATDDGYAVAVALHADGTATSVGAGTVADADVPEPPQIATDVPRAGEIPLAEAGQALYDLLAEAGLEPAWTDAGRPPLLFDVRDPVAAELPWELTRAGVSRPFALQSAPACRARLPFAAAPLPTGVPIRLLVVVDSRADDSVLAQIDEIEAIYQGLATVPCGWQVEVLRGPEEDAFYSEYETFNPDILHLIGHATPEWEGRAMVMQPPGGEWFLTAQYLVETLPRERLPRLVVLNACRTAEASNEVLRYARGLREALLEGGVPAVVAMQGDVASGPAAVFAREFYRGLAADLPLDVATAKARAVVDKTKGSEPRDWALPVLELRGDPAEVLLQQRVIDPVTVIRRHKEFAMVRHMVDRAPQRRRFHDGQTLPCSQGSGGLVFVTGGRRAGKTILTRSCVVSHTVGGTPIVYHCLVGDRRIETATLLIGIVESAGRWLGDGAAQRCAETAVALYGLFGLPVPDDVRRLAGHPESAEDQPQVEVPTLVVPARPAPPRRPELDAYRIVTDLLGTLGTAERPVVLVLDGAGLVQDSNSFLDGLIIPASEDRFHNLRVVIVENEDALGGIAGSGGPVAIDASRRISVAPFVAAEATQLVREYLARCRPDGVTEDVWATVRSEVITWAAAWATRDDPLAADTIELAVRSRMADHGLAEAGRP